MLVSTSPGFLYYDTDTNALSTAVDLSYSLGSNRIFGVCYVEQGGRVVFVVATDYKGTYSLGAWQIPQV